jgi:HAD superfamily hydrolase (TIGR01509 family)
MQDPYQRTTTKRDPASPMLKALLWDNDGVLIDTEGLFFRATRDALMNAGIELSRELYIEYALRQGRSCFDLAAARGWKASQISELRVHRDRVYSAMLADAPAPMKHARDTLALLHERFHMAVVTTSKAEHFYLMHRRSGLLEFFEFAITREDYERSKPDPEPYIAALKRLQLKTEQCVAIEDSERGLAAANAADLRCIVIPSGLTKGGNFKTAATVLASVSALPEALRFV